MAKVRAYVNGHKPGFKKFLKWVEAQSESIDLNLMAVDWVHKVSASDVLHDFMMLHTLDDAQVVIE